MKILKCRTNHMKKPLGFAMEYAVVSWVADSDTSKKQVRAQIKVALDTEMREVIYSSDASENPDCTAVKLPIDLKPRTAYYWTVQVWGDAGDTAISNVNYFETGKREEVLQGEWITTPWEDKGISPYIRKNFSLTKEVKKARLYMTGLGMRYVKALAGKIGVNETATMGIVASMASSSTTFGIMKNMDKKGVVLNSAFAVSGAFAFASHLAFTISIEPSYVPSMIVGKLVSGGIAVIVALILYPKLNKFD